MEAQLQVNYAYLEYHRKQLTIQNQKPLIETQGKQPNHKVNDLPFEQADVVGLQKGLKEIESVNPANGLYVVYEEVSFKFEQISIDLKIEEPPARPTLGDYSPEAVSDRIVNFIESLYGLYKQMHGESEEGLDDFFSQVREGVERGFAEARDILEGYAMLTEEVNNTIDETYKLTIEKVNALYDKLFEALNEYADEVSEEIYEKAA